MLVISENYIHIDHIMWQPFFQCLLKCNNCYMHKAFPQGYAECNTEILNLIFGKEQKINCDQLTISVDTVDSVPENLKIALNHMISIYALNQSSNELTLPKLCITVNNFNSFISWIWKWSSWNALSYESIFPYIHLISFTKPPMQYEIKMLRKYNPEINIAINHIARKNQLPTAIEKSFQNKIKPNFLHLLIEKQPLGLPTKLSRILNYFFIASKSINNLNISKFIRIDACGKDNLSNEYCSAGIGKIHIWPNGAVTGCPYDSLSVQNINKNESLFDRIKKTISDSKENHSMKRCKLFGEYKARHND